MALALDTAPAGPDPRPDLTRAGMSYRDEPVAYHGPDRDEVLPGRSVIVIPGGTWPAARPEDCQYTGLFWFWWAGDGLLLVCPGCGLDGT
jgi:hypothetical protein